MNTGYPYTVEADENGGFFVQFIDIENAFTEGNDLEEAKFNAEEVLSLVLSCILDDNETIPEPSVCPENAFIAYPASKIQTAILLRKARGNRSIVDLANCMNTTLNKVERLESPKNSPSLNELDKAAKALGKKLVLSFE
jgi:antitoxin HicB